MIPPPHSSTNDRPAAADRSPSALKRTALGGFFWLSLGNAVRALAKIAIVAVLARLLAPEAFGLVAAAGVVIWLSTILSSLGVGAALVQRATLEPIDISTAFIASVALGVALGGLMALGAEPIAALFRLPGMVPVLQALAIVFPAASVAIVGECLLQRHLRFATLASVELASYVAGYGVVGITLAWLGLGVWALVAAEIAKTVVKSALFLFATPPPPLRFSAVTLRRLLRFGSGYTISQVSTYLGAQGDSFVVARFLGAAALGAYGRAYDLMMVPAQALGGVLDKILFPTLARLQDDRASLAVAYRRCTALVADVVLPLSVVAAVLAPEIVRALLGEAWSGAVLPLQILAVAMYFRVGYMVGQSIANAVGEVHRTAWRSTAHAGLVVVGALLGQRFGLPGVAAGVAFAILMHFLLVLQLGVRVTGVRWRAIAAVHVPAVLLASVAGAEAVGIAIVSRESGASAVVTLLVAALLIGVTLLAVARYAPRALGIDGRWIVETLVHAVPRRLRFLIRADRAA